MDIAVPFLSEGEIELAATRLLVEFSGGRIRPPVPVENIVEKHLKLTLGFDDLHERLGILRSGNEPEVLGALWAESREVLVDESLDPDEYPEQEGRYRFTLAHEIGHYCLHKDFLTSPAQQGADLFGFSKAPTVIYRESQAKVRIERQADSFASCLLMPKPWVRIVWRELFSRSNALVFSAWPGSDWTKPPLGWRESGLLAETAAAVEYFFYRASKPMAAEFGVSVQAMRVRLEQLGLLLVDDPRQHSLAF